MKLVFWISFFLIFYTFIGYGIAVVLLVNIKRAIKGKRKRSGEKNILPSLTIIVAAYNEEEVIEEKIKNTLALQYPPDKIHYLFITDGSSDSTPDKIAQYPAVQLLHQPHRSGKVNAVHRAMQEVTTEIAVFTDANTYVNNKALLYMAGHYADKRTGAVAGEKRVQVPAVSDATAGESFYWKYESALKKWDADLYTVVGAAGELFSIRTALYQTVPPDTILDDLMISLLVCCQGYRIAYEPRAFALERSSMNTAEELKRKIRIAAGGVQSMLRLPSLFNPFRFGVLTFQYISHRVLRWTIAPFCTILALLLNSYLAFFTGETLYKGLLAGQLIWYTIAIAGWIGKDKELKAKFVFIPFYFCLMNYAVLAGIIRYCTGGQQVTWEKAKRKIA